MDYLGFGIVLNSLNATGVSFGYVLDSDRPFSQRVSSIAEALSELAHGAAFGDTELHAHLHTLLGNTKAAELMDVAAQHP